MKGYSLKLYHAVIVGGSVLADRCGLSLAPYCEAEKLNNQILCLNKNIDNLNKNIYKI